MGIDIEARGSSGNKIKKVFERDDLYTQGLEAADLGLGSCHTHLGNRQNLTETRDVSVTNPAGVVSSYSTQIAAGPRVAKSSAQCSWSLEV